MAIPIFVPNLMGIPSMNRPAEFTREEGWFQHGQRTRVKKPYYHFIWPKDGRNGSKWGRAKDILTGKGPDIHVTVSKDRMDYMHNRQCKSTWARHLPLDDRRHDYKGTLKSPWGRLSGSRRGVAYDFLTRTYRRPDWKMMTDARWREGPEGRKDPMPVEFRDYVGNWWQHDPHGLQNFWWDNVLDPALFF
jgi:hypothetical protein